MSEPVSAAVRALVRERARGRCEYCLLHEDDAWVNHEPDHIVATNKTSVGLHAWGNVVWACKTCNKAKRDRPWREFLKSISSDEAHDTRVARVEAFQRQYGYDTNDELAALAADLYARVKRLIEMKVAEAEPIISAAKGTGRNLRT